MQELDILSQIKKINWFHHFDKETFGFETKGKKRVKNIDEIKRWSLTAGMLKDKTVLDIGANDGYNSFYAEKMGAKKVLAIEHPAWSGEGPLGPKGPQTKNGFDLAHKILNSKVESLDIDLFDTTPEKIGTFDVVLFFGVLYHLEKPLEGLKKAIDLTEKLLIVETTCELLSENDPLFIYKPKRFSKDLSSYYSPNLSRIKELFKDTGFKKVTVDHWHTNEYGGRVICYAEK
jgi:tRNA (mo5U34)-methyltransferase